MLRRARVRGEVTSGYPPLLWTIALNAIALNSVIMFVLPAEAMLTVRLLRLKARKRRLAKEG